MKTLALSTALAMAIGAWSLSPALAQQAPPPGAVMIIPGVYTTPEISRKCLDYAAKRVVGGGHTDNSRQAVAAACARKLMAKEAKKKKA